MKLHCKLLYPTLCVGWSSAASSSSTHFLLPSLYVWSFKIKAALGEGTHTPTLPVPGTPSSLGPQKSLTASHLTPLRLPPKLCSSISEGVVLQTVNSSSTCAHNTENQMLLPHASQVICLSWYKTTTPQEKELSHLCSASGFWCNKITVKVNNMAVVS